MRKLWISLLAGVLLFFLFACGESDEEETKTQDTITPVEIAEVTEGDFVVDRNVYGRTTPRKTSPVMIQQPGEVDEINVVNGESVKEDDVIAKIKSQAGTEEVRAPKDGEVAHLDVSEGDLTPEDEPFATIIDLEEMFVEASVTKDVRSLFKKDDELDVSIDDETFTATITSISKMPDDSGLYPVKAVVTNEDEYILPGMVAEIHVPETSVEDTLIVPTEAVIEESDDIFVYVLEDDKAIKTDVTVKDTQSDKTALEGDLEKGDEVVINGQLTLSDGSKVEVTEEENAS